MIKCNVQRAGFGSFPKFRSYPGTEILIVNKEDFLHNFPYPVYLCSAAANSCCQCLLPRITDVHTDQLGHQNLDSFLKNIVSQACKSFMSLWPYIQIVANSIVAKTTNLIHFICPLWKLCHDHIVIVEIFSEYLSKLQAKTEWKLSSQVWITLTRN